MTLDPHATLETEEELERRLTGRSDGTDWERARRRYVERAMSQQDEYTRAINRLADAALKLGRRHPAAEGIV